MGRTPDKTALFLTQRIARFQLLGTERLAETWIRSSIDGCHGSVPGGVSEKGFATVREKWLILKDRDKAKPLTDKVNLFGRTVPVKISTKNQAAVHLRVSTAERKLDLQFDGLHVYAERAGLEIVREYIDVAGRKQGRPQLDALMPPARDATARRHPEVINFYTYPEQTPSRSGKLPMPCWKRVLEREKAEKRASRRVPGVLHRERQNRFLKLSASRKTWIGFVTSVTNGERPPALVVHFVVAKPKTNEPFLSLLEKQVMSTKPPFEYDDEEQIDFKPKKIFCFTGHFNFGKSKVRD